MIAPTVSPTFNFISSALRRLMMLSTTWSPTWITTWAITSPRVISVILPIKRLRAESLMGGHDSAGGDLCREEGGVENKMAW
jgi:hypothetical protein